MSDWISIRSEDDLSEALRISESQPVLLFKHSNRCGISAMAKRSLTNLDTSIVQIYLIDVINDRSMSNRISELFDIHHESPQGILLIEGKVVWFGSHSKVRAEAIELHINQSHMEQS